MAETGFSTHIFNQYLPNLKSLLWKPTTFSTEKISFSLKLLSGHFYGQFCIKTVRGPSFTYFCGLFFATIIYLDQIKHICNTLENLIVVQYSVSAFILDKKHKGSLTPAVGKKCL